MKIAFIRGKYLNNFELQSYYPIMKSSKEFKLIGFTSTKPMHTVEIPIKQCWSPVDLPDFPYKLPILNRTLGDAMYLFGLENKLVGFDIAHTRETYFYFSKQAVDAKKRGVVKKVLLTCSETIPHNHETIRGRRQMKQYVIQNTDYFHCLTEKAKRVLIEEGASEEKISVIPYGVELSQFNQQLIGQKLPR